MQTQTQTNTKKLYKRYSTTIHHSTLNTFKTVHTCTFGKTKSKIYQTSWLHSITGTHILEGIKMKGVKTNPSYEDTNQSGAWLCSPNCPISCVQTPSCSHLWRETCWDYWQQSDEHHVVWSYNEWSILGNKLKGPIKTFCSTNPQLLQISDLGVSYLCL